MKYSKKKYTRQMVLDAIDGCNGIVLNVARKLHCEWHVAKNYINLWEETKTAFSDETETCLDHAELKLYERIDQGDTQLIKWFLSTKGKKRGYSEIEPDAEKEDHKFIEFKIVDESPYETTEQYLERLHASESTEPRDCN